MKQLLLVEDNVDDAFAVVRALRTSPYTVKHVRTGAEAQEAARHTAFDIVLSDYRLPDISGVQVCRSLRAAGVMAHIVLVSSLLDDETARRAFDAGANDCITKGVAYGDAVSRYLASVMVVQ